MSLRDDRGLAVGTSSRGALAASEKALWRFASFYGDPLADLDAAIAADPGWLLPRVMKAGFLAGLTEARLAGAARETLAGVDAIAASAPSRERMHLDAVRKILAGDWRGGGDAWAAWLESNPRDLLALQWSLLFDFHRGDAAALLAGVERVLPAWSEGDPLYPYVLGHHAFGLEESGRYDEAEATGRRALDGAARVPWAIHAVAHVMEMRGRHVEGRAWMARWRPHWGEVAMSEPNGFAAHLGWHEALFALESLDHASALAVFDRYLDASRLEITLQRVDAASLLWRLGLQGADVGSRWQTLLAGWPLEPTLAGQSAFNDVHALIALVGAGEIARAHDWVGASIDGAMRRDGWNRDVMREVGAPLMQAWLDFAAERHDVAFEALVRLDGVLPLIGGSHAQRDVVAQTAFAAAARGRRSRAPARVRLAERRAGNATTPLAAWWAEALA